MNRAAHDFNIDCGFRARCSEKNAVVATTGKAFSCGLVRLRSALSFRKRRFRKALRGNDLITKPLRCQLRHGGNSFPCNDLQLRRIAFAIDNDNPDDNWSASFRQGLVYRKTAFYASKRGSDLRFFKPLLRAAPQLLREKAGPTDLRTRNLRAGLIPGADE